MSHYGSILSGVRSTDLDNPPTCINTCGETNKGGALTDPIVQRKVEALIRWHNGLIEALNAYDSYWDGTNRDTAPLEQLRQHAVEELLYYGDEHGLSFNTSGKFVYLVGKASADTRHHDLHS